MHFMFQGPQNPLYPLGSSFSPYYQDVPVLQKLKCTYRPSGSFFRRKPFGQKQKIYLEIPRDFPTWRRFLCFGSYLAGCFAIWRESQKPLLARLKASRRPSWRNNYQLHEMPGEAIPCFSETPRSRPPGCLRNPKRVKGITSFPRSAWECRPGRSRVRLPPRTTQSVEDGIPTKTVGTSRIAGAVVFGEECRFFRDTTRSL